MNIACKGVLGGAQFATERDRSVAHLGARKRIAPVVTLQYDKRMVVLPGNREPEVMRSAAQYGEMLAVSGFHVEDFTQVAAAVCREETAAFENNLKAGLALCNK